MLTVIERRKSESKDPLRLVDTRLFATTVKQKRPHFFLDRAPTPSIKDRKSTSNMAEEDSTERPEEDFVEPNSGFKALLSRWDKMDSTRGSFVRLPGLKKESSGSKKKIIVKGDSSKNVTASPSKVKSKKTWPPKPDTKKDSTAPAPKKAVEEESSSGSSEKKEEDRAPELVAEADASKAEKSKRVVPKRKKSRQDLKKEFDQSNQPLSVKKKVLRQPVNVYQPAAEFKEGFKPPKFKKTDEEKELIKKALRKNFVFADLTSKELRPLISAFEPFILEAGQTIIKQGDPGDYFYIIQKGRVTFQVDGVDVGKAGKGSSFGELALLYTCPRAATVVAAKPTKVFRVDQNTFQFILQNQTAESEKEKLDLLKGVNFLKDLTETDLKTLTKVMTPRIFSEEDILVKKGDPGDAFYVIQEGEVWVKDISVGSAVYQDMVLGPGEHFGERALVTSEPRAANVIGKTRGVAFSIDRETFQKVLGQMHELVIKSSDATVLSGIKLFVAANLDNKDFAQLAGLMQDSCLMEKQWVMEEGKQIPASLYIVREGSVIIKTVKDGVIKEVGAGGYFGEDNLLTGVQQGGPRISAPYSISASSNCTLGVLTLSDCQFVFDTERLTGRKKAPSFTMTKEELSQVAQKAPQKINIKLEDLEKKTILGAGSFGQVWLVSGKDDITNEVKAYALKVQAKHDLYMERQINACIREKQLLWEINHPFVVNLVATYQDPNFVYFLTEFIQGGELFSAIHKEEGSGMEEKEAKHYAFGIADAISHLHTLKIVYRDMKPENVLIDAKGFPMLVDFGFAKYCPDKTFTFCGTPGYVPPEIITKRGHDCSADNWSLGILLYEMISGKPCRFLSLSQLNCHILIF